jgi:hypothetical protein
MFEQFPNQGALRGFAVAVSLALLAGCGADASNTADNQATGAASTSTTTSTPPASSTSTTSTPPTSSTSTTTTTPPATTTSTTSTTSSAPTTSTSTSGAGSSSPPASTTLPATAAAPKNLVATAASASVSLSWTASSGATSYAVKRATTSGGPYSQIATPGATTYSDSSVTDGTTYYYVVSAVDSAGASANSAQVSAEPVAAVSNPAPTTFGTWVNVTPSSINLTANLSCGNYGSETVQVDPANPSNLYTEFNCQGIFKSTDYGATWTGPINTGTNGATVTDCAGGITISPTSTAAVPTIYEACIRGAGTGFWKSVDGGVNWTNYAVAPSGTSRQDYYPPVVDPYDPNHLLMAGHEMDYLVQSVDGGQTWTNVTMAGGMLENGGTGAIFFINTGNASTTRGTWLWMAQQAGGVYGTWRTTNNGASWAQVDNNEHPHGSAQIYQPDNDGVVYIAGAYSTLGWGVLRSTNYGQTWSHVGGTSNETVVAGSSKNLYSMFGYPIGPGGTTSAAFEIAAQPGTGNWAGPGIPGSLTQGSAQIAVANDGTHNILVGAMWNSGVWRYIEP